MISTAIFVVTVGALIVIFVVITKIQVKESGVAEVNQQSQFLLGQIQYYIQNARLVDMTADVANGTLKLREADPTKDPTYISLGSAISNGLVGYWNLDEGSGASAADSSGNGNTGSLIDSPTWTTGEINGALSLDGSTQYVKVTDTSSLELSGSWTVSSWVNATALPSSGSKGKIIDKETSVSGNTNYALALDNNQSCGGLGWRSSFTDISGISYQTCYLTTINTGTWYHVVGVWDSSTSNEYLYLNGALVATRNYAGHVPTSASGGQLDLGQQGNNLLFLNGTIDDVRVYNRALSASEVQQLYNPTVVYLQQTDSGTPTPLTSSKVNVSSLNFTRHYQIASSTAIGNESVSYSFTMAPATAATANNFSQTIQSAAAVLGPVPKIALIQKAMGENANPTFSGVSSTYSGANASGSLLLAVVSNQGSTSSNPTVTDTAGNTWSRIALVKATNTIGVYAAANSKNGTNTVTAAFAASTSTNASIFLYEYRGANTVLSVDASSSQTQINTATPSSGFINPQGNAELLLGVSAYNSLIDTWTPGSGYAIESSSTVSATLVEDRVIYVTSPVDASWTINNQRSTLNLVVATR